MTNPVWGQEFPREIGVYRIRLSSKNTDPNSWRVFEVFTTTDNQLGVEFMGSRFLLDKFIEISLEDNKEWAKLPEPVEQAEEESEDSHLH